MAIPVTCPDCSASYQVADQLDGKKVRCKECDAAILVDSEAPPRRASRPAKPRRENATRITSSQSARPQRPRRERDDDDDARRRIKKKKQSGVPLALILGGAGAVLLLLGGAGLVVYLVFRTASLNSPTPVAVVTGPAVPPPQNPIPDQNQQPAPNPVPQANPAPPPDPFVQPNPVFPPPNFPAAAPPAPLTPWQVQPDPLPAELAPPSNPKGSIPVSGFAHLVTYPSSASPFVAVANKAGFNSACEVWNLKTMKRVGPPIAISLSATPALSADGVNLAAPAFGGAKMAVDVWNVADGRNGKIIVDDKPGLVQGVDFAGSGKVLTVNQVGIDVLVQVWDVQTGRELSRFKAASLADRKQRAVSAGRKYIATFARTFDRIMFYDLTTGQEAGDLPVAWHEPCQGLAFSSDGKAFAGLFGGGFSGHLQIWDVATGQSIGEHQLDKLPLNSFSYEGQSLEWSQEGGLMLFGELLMNAKNGAVYWTLPTDNLVHAPRRLFGSACVAYVKSEGQKKTLIFDSLPEDKVAAALKAAQAGQDPDSASMPAVKAADWASVKELPAPAGAVEWKAGADGAPTAKGVLGKSPITLRAKADGVARILFSRPEVGQAAVLSLADATAGLSASRQVHLERYDLAAGKQVGSADLFMASFPKDQLGRPPLAPTLDADLSPDGAMLAIREPKTGKRIDVWSMAEGKHVVGWLPYEKEADGRVRWLAFLDAKHLLTVNGVGKLTLWDVPECKALYSVSFVRDTPALSVGLKYLTAFNGSNFEVLEAATGERVGQLFRPNTQSVQATAYSRDGRELAAVVTTPEGLRLVRWDATTGAVKDEFAVAPGGNELEWCGSDHVLFGSTLIDLKLKWPVAFYNLPGPGRQTMNSPDGRHWFAAARNPNGPPLLSAETLPDEATRQLAKQAANAKVLLAPGMTIQVSAQGAAAPGVDAAAYHSDIAARQSQHLQARGFKIGAGAPVALTLQIQPARDTGQTRTYKAIGRLKQNIDVHVIEVTATATLTDAGGAVIWTQKNSSVTPIVASVNTAESFQDALNKVVWNMAAGWAGSVAPPPVLLRTGAGVESLPRLVVLTTDH